MWGNLLYSIQIDKWIVYIHFTNSLKLVRLILLVSSLMAAGRHLYDPVFYMEIHGAWRWKDWVMCFSENDDDERLYAASFDLFICISYNVIPINKLNKNILWLIVEYVGDGLSNINWVLPFECGILCILYKRCTVKQCSLVDFERKIFGFWAIASLGVWKWNIINSEVWK